MAQSSRRVGPHTAAVAAELRSHIERLGLTHAQVSERSGIPRSTVSKILTGERATDLEEVAALACVFEVRVSELMRAVERFSS